MSPNEFCYRKRPIWDRFFKILLFQNFPLWSMENGEEENSEDKIAKKSNMYLYMSPYIDNMGTLDWDNFLKSCPSCSFVKKVTALVLSTILKMNMVIGKRSPITYCENLYIEKLIPILINPPYIIKSIFY